MRKPTSSELLWCLVGACLSPFLPSVLFMAAICLALFVLPALIGAGLGKLAGSALHMFKPVRIQVRRTRRENDFI